MNEPYITPPYLKEGSRILILAPAGSFQDREALDKACRWIEKQGWVPEIHPQTFRRWGSLAGPDNERLKVLQEAFERPDIDMIWSVRGGYGTIRIVDRLDFVPLQKYPKWLTGFSDITVLHARAWQEKIKTWHALMPVQFKNPLPADVLDFTARIWRGEHDIISVPRDAMNRNEIPVEGRLTGGNAAVLASCLSACRLDFSGAILFLEDVGEHLYALDRIFQTLRRAGIFEQIKALVLGHFTDIRHDSPPFPYSIKQIVLNATAGDDLPVFFGLPAGHEPDNYPLIFGENYRIEVGEKEWTFQPKPQKVWS